ncbi:MAG: hypothetical protein L3K26_00760 [Candidatus Hydrogenedentes bacterium]|nr:hypothetical protein [Candidatus Hydrogenedentota bacterium]
MELANQLGETYDKDESGRVPRRQLALRSAIDKIRPQQVDAMAYEEIGLVLDCHSLLTSRREPTARDQRLKRILDGSVKILRRRKAELEGN